MNGKRKTNRRESMTRLLELASTAGQRATGGHATPGTRPARAPSAPRTGTHAGRAALLYRERNPQAFGLFVQFARELANTPGVPYVGTCLVWERVRWELLRVHGKADLDNYYRSHFARMALAECPDLRGKLRIRGKRE